LRFFYWIYGLIVIIVTTMINLGDSGRPGSSWGSGHSSSWSSTGGHK